MAGNSFGKIFHITTFGESHGPSIGVIIDGCPSGIDIEVSQIQKELNRRKPGQSHITTQRKESDQVRIESGVFEGKSTGTPIALIIENEDARSKDYSHISEAYRPNHADYTYQQKYGIRDHRGGGRSSARETAARVAAGAIAGKILNDQGIKIFAYVSRVGNIECDKDYTQLDLNQIENNIIRCPDPKTASKMIELIEKIRKDGDTIGGIITCIIKNSPIGLGEPVFDKLHADLAKAMLGINAVQGFEYGSGFEGAYRKGSENNDIFVNKGKTGNNKSQDIHTLTNHSGGIQGGISNGEDIYFKVAFKPVATIMQEQNSVDIQGNSVSIAGKGRHDPCVLPRAVPIVEAMASLVMVDHLLRYRAYSKKSLL
jgi:chorismate synthase